MRILALVVLSLLVVSCSHGGHGRHHKMWEKMDTNSDGTVSKAEFDKAHGEKFKKMDANSDGKVTKEEMKAFKKAHKKKCCKKKKGECKDGKCEMKHKHKHKHKDEKPKM